MVSHNKMPPHTNNTTTPEGHTETQLPANKQRGKGNVKAVIRKKGQQLQQKIFPEHWEDGEFMDDVRQATLRGAHPAAHALFWSVGGFFVLALLWAAFARVDEVTTGVGKVIPSSQVQVLQNLEGGIVDEILVREGEVVEKGQPLIRIDDTGFASSFGEKQTRILTLAAQIARMEAEVSGETPVWPKQLQEKAPDILQAENTLYESRLQELASSLNILKRQSDQREQELKEIQTRHTQAERNLKLAREELNLAEPMEAKGVVSKVEILRLKRQLNDALAEKEATQLVIEKSQAALTEAHQRVAEKESQFKNETLKELAEKRQEYARLNEVMRAVEDQVERTVVRAPVRGTINRLLVHTIGGVVQPGMDLVELIPLDDSLLVEAKIRPKDIAFLRPGQQAQVKITAYDYTIYGGLKGYVENIGSDTITDENGNAYYRIRVRTEKNYLGTEEKPHPIISGMVASVDIVSGKKTVLDYLLKPLRRAHERALRER